MNKVAESMTSQTNVVISGEPVPAVGQRAPSAGYYDNVLETVGATPLVALRRLFPQRTVLAKLEGFNPGGSAKDRAARSMLQHGLETGAINQSTTIIESSSGNMGIGLALASAYHKLRFICVVDPKASTQNIAIMKAYGAEIHLVDRPDPATGEFLQARLAAVTRLLEEVPGSVWTNQYANELNAAAHHQTMWEIDLALGGALDLLFCATSTCGTLRGCLAYIESRGLGTRVVAVDAVGSQIFGSRRPSPRQIPGLGASIVPALAHELRADRVMYASDRDCVMWCRRLLQEEAILAGGSSGAVLSAVANLSATIDPAQVCVAILPDRGERYLDSVFSDNWVAEHIEAGQCER